MTGAQGPNHALVRGPPTTFDTCVTGHSSKETVDLTLARRQHRAYSETLESLRLRLIQIEPDDRFPDCCFVEDPAIVVGDMAIVSRMGAPSRVGEEVSIGNALRPFKRLKQIVSPGTLEGGDVLQIKEKIYVGLSSRTNRSGVEQLDALVSGRGFEVIPVEVIQGLHLKSSCTYIGEGTVVRVPGRLAKGTFSEYSTIEIPPEEAPAADCLRVRDRVLILEGYPASRKRIEAEGFETVPVAMSEFEKCEGALTCLSIVF
jgi:dimethylargininase